VNEGRILKHLYTVLGADFYVDKLSLARDAAGNTKIIALVAEGGSRGYPCMNCYVYVLDEDAEGLLRIGPRVGNATPTCPGLEDVQVLDVVPLAVYGTGSIHYDAANVAIMYIPQIIPLVFDVTYIEEETEEAKGIPGALVGVSLLYNKTGARVVYGVNADKGGIARVPIPAERDSMLIVNLTIADISGIVRWQYTYVYNSTAFKEIPAEIYLPAAVLPSKNVDTRPATKVYGVPPFLASLVDFIDITKAPFRCAMRTQVALSLKPSVNDLTLMRGSTDTRVKIIYNDPDEGILNTIVALITPPGISQISRVTDYVGSNARIAAAGTYSDGSYIIAGLSDGRIRLYTSQGQSYRLKHIYVMGSPLINLVTIPNIERNTYVAISSGGVEVTKVEPYPLPIYRKYLSLQLTLGEYIGGDVLADLSTIALFNSNSLVVVKNSDKAVREDNVLTLDEIISKDIEVVVNTPGKEDFRGKEITLSYPWGSTKFVTVGNKFTLNNILPGIIYTLYVPSPAPYIYDSTISFTLRENKLEVLEYYSSTVREDPTGYKLTINMSYMAYSIKLTIMDKVSESRLAGPVNIYADGKIIAENTRSNEHLFQLVYGFHNITVTPARGFENTYLAATSLINVASDTSVTVTLSRKMHSLMLTVLEQGQPISNVAVYIYSFETGRLVTVLSTSAVGVVSTTIPYGVYRIVFSHDKYNEEVVVLAVDKSVTDKISLTPTTYTLMWRYIPIIVGLIAVGIGIYIVLKIRVIIARRLLREEIF
ncbi:MAG: hypothetical protein QXW94_02655, partial [Desulfurococcaceae archaeon]